MPFEIKMPQLGMNQDSAVLVAWLKSAGDQVTKGEPIFEVETDKATMEVEAATDGYLASIRAPEGTDVPVGDLIALIVDTTEAVVDHDRPRSAVNTVKDATKPASPVPAVKETPVPRPEDQTASAPVKMQNQTGKVLASPRAKRMAASRGIDLVDVRARGASEPIHVSDLSSAALGSHSQLTARVDGTALTALVARSQSADRTRLLAAFASGAWRDTFNELAAAIAIRRLDGAPVIYPEPDADARASAPVLSIMDICETRVTGCMSGTHGINLAVARDGTFYVLSLSFDESTLPIQHAVAFLDSVAARVEDPIRQLV